MLVFSRVVAKKIYTMRLMGYFLVRICQDIKELIAYYYWLLIRQFFDHFSLIIIIAIAQTYTEFPKQSIRKKLFTLSKGGAFYNGNIPMKTRAMAGTAAYAPSENQIILLKMVQLLKTGVLQSCLNERLQCVGSANFPQRQLYDLRWDGAHSTQRCREWTHCRI